MSDLLIKLYDLPEATETVRALAAAGLVIRRSLASERDVVIRWVREQFGEAWAAEAAVAATAQPSRCWLATEPSSPRGAARTPYDQPPEALVGFACYDAVRKGLCGPLGVAGAHRGRGVGRGLLLSCLHAMAADGYAYAVAPWVDHAGFYVRVAGATEIADSAPGIYRGPLRGR